MMLYVKKLCERTPQKTVRNGRRNSRAYSTERPTTSSRRHSGYGESRRSLTLTYVRIEGKIADDRRGKIAESPISPSHLPFCTRF